MARLDERTVRKIVAHEMFHAFSMSYNQRRSTVYRSLPQWLVEGGAEFAAESFAGPGVTPTEQNTWPVWLHHPERPLERRTYDGVGFLSLIAQGHGNPWSLLPNRYPDATDPIVDFLNLVPAESGTVMDLWAATTVHDASFGPSFAPTGPGMPDMAPVVSPTSITVDGDAVTQTSVASSSALPVTFDTQNAFTLTVDETSDAGVIVFANHQQQGWGSAGKQATYCVAAGGCECPNHASPASPGTIQGAPGRVKIILATAVGLHPSASSLTLRLQSKAQACAQTPPDDLARCLVGRWKSDPMQSTLDMNGTTMHMTGGDGIRAVLDQNGDGSFDTSDSRPMTGTAVVSGSTSAQADVSMVGAVINHWSVSGDQFVTTPGTGTIHVMETMKVAGQTFTVLDKTEPDAMALLGGIAGGNGQVPPHTMTCDAQHWVTSYTLPSGTLRYSWHREG
jgi:hypothetical protein